LAVQQATATATIGPVATQSGENVVTETPTPDVPVDSEEQVYVVQPGDTMLVIATRMWTNARRCVNEFPILEPEDDGPICGRDPEGKLRFDSNCGLLLAAIGLITGVLTGLFGVAAMLPFGMAAMAALTASFVAQGTFSNLTSGLLAVVVPRHAGVTMAFYSCIGFGGGFLGNVLFGATLDRFGGGENGGISAAVQLNDAVEI